MELLCSNSCIFKTFIMDCIS